MVNRGALVTSASSELINITLKRNRYNMNTLGRAEEVIKAAA